MGESALTARKSQDPPLIEPWESTLDNWSPEFDTTRPAFLGGLFQEDMPMGKRKKCVLQCLALLPRRARSGRQRRSRGGRGVDRARDRAAALRRGRPGLRRAKSIGRAARLPARSARRDLRRRRPPHPARGTLAQRGRPVRRLQVVLSFNLVLFRCSRNPCFFLMFQL